MTLRSIQKGLVVALVLSLLSACMGEKYDAVNEGNSKPQYGVFYFETQGDFVVPLEADAPAIYSWYAREEQVRGDIEMLWKQLGVAGPLTESFGELEVALLNHFSSKGWKLHELEVTSVETSNASIRTAYRYIFKKDN